MDNNLKRIEKELRAFAKKCKDIKYNAALLFSFLVTGSLSLTANKEDSIETAKKGLQTSITDMKKLFREAKAENDKLMKGSNLELVQLMEQGDHVVKSPWSSWQFGMNYFYSDWRGTYKGRGDKKEKYPYEGIFQREENVFNRYVSQLSPFYNTLATSSNEKSASTTLRKGLTTQYGLASAEPVPEPIVSLELSAGIKPRKVDKQPLNIVLGPVNAPSAPILSVAATTPVAAAPPTINPPTVTLNLPEPNTKPFNDFSFTTGRYGDYDTGGSTTAFLNQTEASGTIYTLGVNPNNPNIDPDNLQAGDLNNKAYKVQGGVVSPSGGKVAAAIWRINSKGGSCRYVSSPAACTTGITEGDENTAVVKGFTYGGASATDPVKFYVAGDINDNGTNLLGTANKKGGIALHTVWNGTLHDIEGYLKGRAAMFSIETWHAPKLVFKNIKLDVEGNENTIFYIYPSSYYGVVQNSGDYNSFAQRGAFIGHVDADIKSQKNAIYSVMGLSGSFNITSTGTYKLEGGNNLVYSGLGYSPNFQNLIGQGGNIVDMYGTGMTPIINLKTAPESYGDGNVIMYFSDLLPDAAAGYPYTTIYNDGANRHDSWKKTKIGIHQGELKPSARIGEQLALNSSATTQTSEGNIGSGDNKYVENNVGVLAQSGQRKGIKPSTDLGAVDPTNNFVYVDKDEVHALYINDIDVTFGKYSKGNIMIASERGTQIDVAMPTNSHTEAKNGIALRTDAIVDYNKNHASYTNDNKIVSSTQDSSNEAAIGTIIGYAKGKWSDSTTRMGGVHGVAGMSSATKTALQNAKSEINFGVDVEMSAKYAEVNGTKFNPVAYVADGGKITAKNTKAYGYGSVIAYSKDGGDIAITGNIEAKDEWAASDAATTAEKYKNIGAYADGTGSKVTVSGNATINGLGTLAKGGEVEINGTGSAINTGESAGIAAINGGTVKFGGGSITVGSNGVDNTTPFYADSTSKVNITGTTNINMSKGTILVGAASDYAAAAGTTARYNGMGNVNLTVTGDAKIVKNTVGGPTVTWTGSGSLASDVLTTTKFANITANASNYKAYYSDGTFVIGGNAQLGNATATDSFDNVQLVREKVTINPGVRVYSTTGKGLGMASSTTATSNADSGYDNQGTVEITGGASNKAAMNVSYGTITNNGTVTVDDGVGIYGTNGSKLENTSAGTINVTNSGYGIVGMATGSAAQAYGKDAGAAGKAVEIINDGTINVAGNNGIAIFADDNKGVGLNEITVTNSKTLTLGDGGVGIAVTDSSNSGSGGIIDVTGTGSSDIKVGANGIGIYAQNSTVNLNSNYGIETTDGGVGIYLTGSSALPTSTNLEYKYSGSNTGRGMGIIYNVANSTNNTNVNLVNSTGTTGGIIGIFANGGGTFTNNGVLSGTSVEKEFGIIGENTDVNNAGNITLGNASDPNKPNIGIYAKTNNTVTNTGNIAVGDNAVGIYGYGVNNTGNITAGSQGTAIYSQDGNINVTSGTITLGQNSAVGVYTAGTGQNVNIANGVAMNIGNGSFGFANAGQGNHITSNINSVDLNGNSIYIYSRDNAGIVDNHTKLIANGTSGDNYGIYSAGTVNNYADMDLRSGIGNVGIYSTNGGTASNFGGIISVGDSDTSNSRYSIGMAAGFVGDATTPPAYTGNIVNEGTINVKGKDSIGMYGVGAGTTVYNGTVAGSAATINLEADGAMGIYLDEGAKGFNYGTITTVGTPKKAVGVVVRKGAEFTNHGNIYINSAGGYAFFKAAGGTIKNYGNFTVTGGAAKEFTPGNKPTGKKVGGVEIVANPGALDAQIIAPSGQIVAPQLVDSLPETRDALTSNIGMYIDTLRGTNPITGLSAIQTQKADLIVGAEAAANTRSKYIQVAQNIIKPYNDAITANPQITDWNIYSGSASWISTATIDKTTGLIHNIYLAKIPYTSFAGNKATPVEVTDTYNFLDGLEQRYGVEELGTRENQLFQKLNSIGNNEEVLMFQATDEMMGHQYANVQQRTYGTGRLIDKELAHLSKEWDTKSKQSNKIKVFGMRDEYNTDTAGIIDYTSNAYGFAYLHEDETVKLGNSSGWYAGAVHNRFRFKDIGGSKENQTMLKLGIFKTMSPATDHNGSLQWTISGEGYVSRNDMHRKYLVVDEIFNAKSDYTTYGVALKNELGYNIRTSERTSIRPYGSLKLEYGRFGSIKEKSGEIRLEVEGNDYYSVKPEVGIEFKYKQPMAVRTTFVTTLGLGYENELGRVGNVKNKARVAYTNADWFNIRGEKDDRRGNFKADLNIGVENQRFGVTFNAGYDTKGHNVRGGLGFRVIY